MKVNFALKTAGEMVTGIEAVGLALAVIPLLVNQLDGYVRGIEKVKLLRRYRRELATYSRGLSTQRAVLINTLIQTLGGIVNDEHELSGLIDNPQGPGWKDPVLQRKLRLRLDRNYDLFLDNMSGLNEQILKLAKKLGINVLENKSPDPKTWDVKDFWKMLSRAVYEDLLAKIDGANTILKTLLDQSLYQEEARNKKRHPLPRLLQQYQKGRKHAETLFKTIFGAYWRCECNEQHCVHLQLPTNPLASQKESDVQSKLQMNFSNTGKTDNHIWTWTEVVFEPWQDEKILSLSSLSLHESRTKPKVRFDMPTPKTNQSETTLSSLSPLPPPPIKDFCSSLRITEVQLTEQTTNWTTTGMITSQLDSYIMHASTKALSPTPPKPLTEVISQISRHDRLHIATGLACGVIQYCGNWLKSRWDSSDIHLTAHKDGCDILLDSVYLSWPLSIPATETEIETQATVSAMRQANNNLLLPLGFALVELSLGKSLDSLYKPEDQDWDVERMRRNTASRLVPKVYLESGVPYGEAVESCLSWSSAHSLCMDRGVEERVFERIISPLLRDLVNFEGMM
ncbi:uncharacterized protein N7511_003829 [Penicillium nucicola]|uniref:uncharacterized protein n=1 Tax=Penicillium nucicola TaxID=1850975 RepID=UPI002545760C|nr:uncharacterized protein N7511_003829 [Penicillium nucicola]KAJ5766213.1 hypothetical protein N7511_003829 [Penicillium nucicola]